MELRLTSKLFLDYKAAISPTTSPGKEFFFLIVTLKTCINAEYNVMYYQQSQVKSCCCKKLSGITVYGSLMIPSKECACIRLFTISFNAY